MRGVGYGGRLADDLAVASSADLQGMASLHLTRLGSILELQWRHRSARPAIPQTLFLTRPADEGNALQAGIPHADRADASEAVELVIPRQARSTSASPMRAH
jgi:hypothetical protein